MKLSGDRNQCRGCGAYFNSTRAFDKHRTGRTGSRRCLSKDEMLGMGMVMRDDGFWRSREMPQTVLESKEAS